MLQDTSDTQAQSKRLRQEMSPTEIGLWLALRALPSGQKFRKQHLSGPFIADFYCHSALLVVEVDGAAHDYGDRPARNARRDAWFAARGLAVMRVTARDIFTDCDAVVTAIAASACDRQIARVSL